MSEASVVVRRRKTHGSRPTTWTSACAARPRVRRPQARDRVSGRAHRV